MSKLVLCLAIFLCFLVIGYQIHRAFRHRKQFFESLVRFCDHLTTEIGFSKRTIAQIIDAYLDNYSSQFAEVLVNYKALLDRNQDLTRGALALWGGLKSAEAQVVADFLLELGKHSAAEELEKIRKFRERFETLRQDATEKLKRDASIYFKICILLGIGVVVLLL